MSKKFDPSIRCDNHVGEVFPPRCGACESLAVEYRLLQIDSDSEAVS